MRLKSEKIKQQNVWKQHIFCLKSVEMHTYGHIIIITTQHTSLLLSHCLFSIHILLQYCFKIFLFFFCLFCVSSLILRIFLIFFFGVIYCCSVCFVRHFTSYSTISIENRYVCCRFLNCCQCDTMYFYFLWKLCSMLWRAHLIVICKQLDYDGWSSIKQKNIVYN